MQGFHYNYIQHKYGGKSEMLLILILTVLSIKLKLKVFMKTSLKTNSYLTLVIIVKNQIIHNVYIRFCEIKS